MSRKRTTEQFISEVKAVHGDRYNYDKVLYTRKDEKVIITCPEHGDFEQIAHNHLYGKGCSKCGDISTAKNKISNRLSKKFEGLIQPEDHKLIPLNRGYLCKVDNEDFEELSKHNWCIKDGYAYNRLLGRMHRFIMNAPDHLEVDHIWHDTLDNRKSELRVAGSKYNKWNTSGRKCSMSRLKGVTWIKTSNNWRVKIVTSGVLYYLGLFENEDEAGKAYDLKALETRGEFAYLNFPELKEDYLKQLENGKTQF